MEESAEQKKAIEVIKKWLGTGSINLFGMPLAGKDTQGAILAAMFNGPLISGGDILRNQAVPTEISAVQGQGKLIPTEYYLQAVLPYFSQSKFNKQPLILSSIGRLSGEEDAVTEAAQKSNHPIKSAILIKINHQEALKRLRAAAGNNSRGSRTDDTPETLSTRLQEFQNGTGPVIDYYRSKGLLLEVDGSGSVAKVTKEILDQLYNLATE